MKLKTNIKKLKVKSIKISTIYSSTPRIYLHIIYGFLLFTLCQVNGFKWISNTFIPSIKNNQSILCNNICHKWRILIIYSIIKKIRIRNAYKYEILQHILPFLISYPLNTQHITTKTIKNYISPSYAQNQYELFYYYLTWFSPINYHQKRLKQILLMVTSKYQATNLHNSHLTP